MEKLTNEQASFAALTMGRWMRFVLQTDYVKRMYGSSDYRWPQPADPDHSSLLVRMLEGDDPMPEKEYQEAKARFNGTV